MTATVTRTVLSNGLVLLVEERPTTETVAIELSARVGGREDRRQAGLAVLTSRTMFQGTPRRPSEAALQREANQVGGLLNRGTSNELSQLTSTMPAAEVEVGFDLLADVVLHPLLDEGA
ncbi:MAG TPA: insulinase family protein, partial [Chloroflexota bacterium]|nr:insulinase family protein [Chloroflexota bacterium]